VYVFGVEENIGILVVCVWRGGKYHYMNTAEWFTAVQHCTSVAVLVPTFATYTLKTEAARYFQS